MMQLRFEIGHTVLHPHDADRLRSGSVMSLGQTADEPVTIYADNQRIGRGEVVQVGDKLGVRVTELASRNLE